MKKAAILPPLLAIASFLLSPEFYNKLPDKYAHIVAAIAVVAASLMPSLISSNEAQVPSKT